MRHRVALLAWLCVPLALLWAAPAGAEQAALAWQSLPREPGAPPTVLALDAVAGRVAVGSQRGVRIIGLGGESHGTMRQEAVRELVFSERGILLAAADGLFEGSPRELRRIPLGAAAADREVRDMAARAGLVALATAAGVHVRFPDGERWLRAPLPTVGAERVALLPDPRAGVRVWVWAAGSLWSFPGQRPLRPERIPLPRLAEEAGPVELGSTPDGAFLVLYPDVIAVERGGSWRVVRPGLPPGAEIRRHAHAFGRHWLATDAGLLSADSLDGPWRRVAGGVGSRAVVHMVGDGAALVVADERQVYAAQIRPQAAPVARPESEPALGRVQRRALRHQSLTVGEVDRLRRGVARRAWLPELALSGRYERSRSRGGDYDEVFTSGEMRRLRDRDYDRGRDLSVGITLAWDLGDLAYHPESIDVSREARALVALRDDVLDEVNQLYFDRLRALGELAAQTAGTQRAALEARVAELTAGLDAWTGGWFSQAARDP